MDDKKRKHLFRVSQVGAVVMAVALILNLIVYLLGVTVPGQGMAALGMVVFLVLFVLNMRKYREP